MIFIHYASDMQTIHQFFFSQAGKNDFSSLITQFLQKMIYHFRFDIDKILYELLPNYNIINTLKSKE